MGCINSTKKIHTAKGGNFYKVSLVGLQPDLPSMPRCGMLELRPLELIFTATGKDTFKWALQHLRRYGLNGNIFSFETGRRCIMGPRIYMFRCCNADILYQKFQRYINCITAERNRHGQVMEALEAVAPNEFNIITNHYLQSVTASPSSGNLQQHYSVMNQSETPAITSETEMKLSNEACGNAMNCISKRGHQSEALIHQYANISLTKDELTTRHESNNNNNINCIESKDTKKDINMMYSFKSNANTPTSPLINIHFYGRINKFTPIFVNEFPLEEYTTSKHFYENLIMDKTIQQQEQQYSSHSDLPLIPSNTNPCINYIVLDLHKPTEPTKTPPSSTDAKRTSSTKDQIDAAGLQGILPSLGLLSTTKSYSELPRVSPGYSSIDFVKTSALNKSSGNFTDYDIDLDIEELRVTRHSKWLTYNNKSNLSMK